MLVLTCHGALYIIYKTSGPVQERALSLAPKVWAGVVVAGVAATVATAKVQPSLYANLAARPLTWILVVAIVVCLALVFLFIRQRRELPAFLASAGFIASMLAATAAGTYPKILASTLSPAYDVTVSNAKAGDLGLRIGFVWWSAAIVLAVGYFTYLFRSFRGKVELEPEGRGY
jgi:cytochrome bd ubiquinol oxidase subunit II